MNRSSERLDVLTAFAEFGPASFGGTHWEPTVNRNRYRIGDGLGCVGFGESWEGAANALREARAEHERAIANLDREAAEHRERIARTLGNGLLWAFLGLVALSAIYEAIR